MAGETVEALVERLGDHDWRARQAACSALGQLRDERALEPIIQQLGDSNQSVRQAACEALGSLVRHRSARKGLARLAAVGDLRAVRPLMQLMLHEDARMRHLASRSMDSIIRVLNRHFSHLLCRSCLARFERRAYSVWWQWVHFPVCRICGKASNVVLDVKEVVAVLDIEMTDEFLLADGIAWVSWLNRQNLFDFDRVEVVDASEYDVEGLCIQVGNDTDPFRRPRYRKMACAVEPACSLSQSTLNMLKRTFGQIVPCRGRIEG